MASLIFFVMLLQGLFLLWNLRHYPRLVEPLQATSDAPLVSVVIPARNEARKIQACLTSLQQQTWPALEIIVYDDDSEDDTASLVEPIASTDPRVRLLRGKRLTQGGFGKSNACQQAATHARGDWLLFVDADTTHAHDMVARLLNTARTRKSDLLTGFPRVRNRTLTGWLVTSLMSFVVAMHLPVRLVETSADPKFVAANGALMLFRRDVYQQIGGHGAAGQHLVEDMELAKAVKKAGHTVSLVEVSSVIAVEMYDTAGEVWQGYTKNLYAGLGRSPWLLVAVLSYYFCLFVLPWLLLSTSWLYALAALLGVLYKALIDKRFSVPPLTALGMPVSALLLILIGLYSGYRSWSGQGYRWKGRMYS